MNKWTIYILLALCAVGFAIFQFRSSGAFDGPGRDDRYDVIQAKVLAQSLVKDYNGNGKCLIIHQPVSKNGRQFLDKKIGYFKDGFGDSIKELIVAPIKDIDIDKISPEEAAMEMTAADFNRVINKHRDCDIIITLVPLPFAEIELNTIDLFDSEREGTLPRLGIYNGYIGNIEPFITNGAIHSITLFKPNPIIDEQPVPQDVTTAFNRRYILITSENIGEIKEKYPSLFPMLK